MTLDDYLKIDGNTVAGLADKANTTGASIHRILHGDQKPSHDMIKAIVEATDGEVSADDLVFGAPRAKKDRAA